MQVDTKLFQQSVADIVRAIPPGRVLTYGHIATLAGFPKHARLVGRVLHGMDAPDMPCHRVVNGTGRTAPGWYRQIEMLRSEGVRFRPNGCVDLKTSLWLLDDLI
ncbi:MGMT family protein [Prevotella sp. A2931]|uniref:MGMT family protein n=1 Tax=Prevotella illustrans TaxID=2800387 RepID=A0ABS3M419_9BACT|nr:MULTISPECIES: MGMT family protein [Prevotella]MBO1362936.1 MGMT family protein [Prevotella illustrans]PTL27159.1 cysteine methyltransferase [Prevotella sp. oral taxon 820]